MQEILIIDEARVIPPDFYRLAKNRLEINSFNKFNIIDIDPVQEPWVFLLAMSGTSDRLYEAAMQIFEIYPKSLCVAVVERDAVPEIQELGIINQLILKPVDPGLLLKSIQNTVRTRLLDESLGYLKSNLKTFTKSLGEMGKVEAQLDYYTKKFQMISQLMSCMLSTGPLKQLIARVGALMQNQLQCENISLLLYSSKQNNLLGAYGPKPSSEELNQAGSALTSGKFIVHAPLQEETPGKARNTRPPTVFIPLGTAAQKMGVLCVRRQKDGLPFTESELNIILMMGSQVAIALEDSSIYEKIQKATDKLKKREKDMQALYEIEKMLREQGDNVFGLYSSIARHIKDVLNSDLVTIFTPVDAGCDLINMATAGSHIGLISSIPIERSRVGAIWKEEQPVRSKSLDLGGTFPNGPGIAMPVKGKDTNFALICSCRNLGAKPFTDDEYRLLQTVSQKVSTHAEGIELVQNIVAKESEKARIQESFQQYVSPDVVNKVLDSQVELGLHGSRKPVAVFMCGLHDFHHFYSNFEPEVVVTVLEDFFSLVTDIVFEHGGTVDKFIAEVVMAVFGAPLSSGNDSEQAVRAAMKIMQGTRELVKNWKEWKPELSSLSCRMAVNSGEAIAGNIGSARRLEYTVIGDTVNTCARFKSAAGPWQFYIGTQTAREVEHLFPMKALAPLTLKGKAEPVPVFTLEEYLSKESEA